MIIDELLGILEAKKLVLDKSLISQLDNESKGADEVERNGKKYVRQGPKNSVSSPGKWYELKEAKNHLGEPEYTTWDSWKRAAKKKNPAVWFEGDKDIAQAFVGPKPYKRGETKAIGEWDGEKGSIFLDESVDLTEAKTEKVEIYHSAKAPGQLGDIYTIDATSIVTSLAKALGVKDGWKEPIKIGDLYVSLNSGDRLAFFTNERDYTPDEEEDY